MYRILSDEDIRRDIKITSVIEVMEQTLRAKAEGALTPHQRFSIVVGGGSLVFTPGAETKYTHSLGFRAYDTFADPSVDHHQLVAVFDSQTGSFRGLVVGRLAGALRIAGINAVAIKYMARQDARQLGILGSGFQARALLQAALAVRGFERVKVFSPNSSHRDSFAAEMSANANLPIEASDTAEEVVRFGDVLICATTSTENLFEAGWVKPGAHVSTVGPKSVARSEVPYELAQRSRVIAADSLEQADANPRPFFLKGRPERERMVELGDIVLGKQTGRSAPDDVTLFCSVGLAGAEVVVADLALRECGGVGDYF